MRFIIIAAIMTTLFRFVSSLQSWLFVLCCICVYFITVALYRLYLSPLAKFPGPKLAAVTYGVEFYYDVLRRGQYTFEILKMHEKYGAQECLERISALHQSHS